MPDALVLREANAQLETIHGSLGHRVMDEIDIKFEDTCKGVKWRL